MKRSEHLFQLVKSLSKSEKRAFKLFASRHMGEHNNYIQLFDLIDKQDVYDEQKIIKRIKNQKLVDHLSSVKVQLYNMLLKSLRLHNSVGKTSYEVREYMDFIEILYEKGLYGHCKKVLIKAQKLALKYDYHNSLDMLSIFEYNIAIKEGNYNDLQHYVDETYPKIKEVRGVNEMLAEYEYLLAKVKLLTLKSKRTGRTIDKAQFEDLVQHELLRQSPEEQPLRCQVDYHTVWGYYHLSMANKEKTYYHRKMAMETLQQRPQDVLEWPRLWIDQARMLLIALGHFRMYDEFEIEQRRITKFVEEIAEAKKTKDLNSEIYTTIYNTKMDCDIDRGYFNRCAEYIGEAEEHFKEFQNQIPEDAKMVLYCNFSYAYFGGGNYHKALHWVNHLINGKFGVLRMDIQCIARIMNIVIHYELENYDLINPLIRSTNRFLVKMERKFKVETSFLKFANKYLLEAYVPDMKDGFLEEINQLNELANVPLESRTLDLFNIANWLRSKVEGKSLEEVTKNIASSNT